MWQKGNVYHCVHPDGCLHWPSQHSPVILRNVLCSEESPRCQGGRGRVGPRSFSHRLAKMPGMADHDQRRSTATSCMKQRGDSSAKERPQNDRGLGYGGSENNLSDLHTFSNRTCIFEPHIRPTHIFEPCTPWSLLPLVKEIMQQIHHADSQEDHQRHANARLFVDFRNQV